MTATTKPGNRELRYALLAIPGGYLAALLIAYLLHVTVDASWLEGLTVFVGVLVSLSGVVALFMGIWKRLN